MLSLERRTSLQQIWSTFLIFSITSSLISLLENASTFLPLFPYDLFTSFKSRFHLLCNNISFTSHERNCACLRPLSSGVLVCYKSPDETVSNKELLSNKSVKNHMMIGYGILIHPGKSVSEIVAQI